MRYVVIVLFCCGSLLGQIEADFNIVNVVDIPHLSLGANKTKFKTQAQKLQSEGKITQILDENGCYHIVIPQPQN